MFLLTGWYIALLVPTLVFKYLYLAALSGDSSTNLGRLAAGGRQIPLWWVYVRDIAPADFLDVLVLVVGFWLVGRMLRRTLLVALACTSVLAVVLVGGAHVIAVREVGAWLTLDTVRITRDWLVDHPALIGQFLYRPRRLAWLLGGLAWTMTPLLFAAMGRRLYARQPRLSVAVAVASVLVVAYSVVFGASTALASTHGALQRGFWESIALSALAEDSHPVDAAVQSRAQLLDSWEQLAYPSGHADSSYLVEIPSAARIPRHLVIISLETAPLEYYPLIESAELPAFQAMSAHAIVSTEHYATAPVTNLVMYSLVSGTYPPPGSLILRDRFRTDGLADALSEHGYETSFIESYDLRWDGRHDERLLRDLGFPTIRDAIELTGKRLTDWDSYRIIVETQSFDAALKQVVSAARGGRKAFVCLETNLGHYEWLNVPGRRGVSGAERIAYTVKTLDGLMGRFLNGLAANGLSDDVLIVVVGDHGLRLKMEFASVPADVTYGDLVFNVSFLAYAPGLFPRQVRLPFATSHVDIAPTVLDLLGIPRGDRLYLGSNMLDRRLADRVVFLPSASYLGLYPADGLRWKNHVYSLNRIVDRVTVRAPHSSRLANLTDHPELPLSDTDVRRVLRSSRAVFGDTAAYFLRRITQAPDVPGSRE